MISLKTSVADLVVDRPARARIFERLGIDYCCGGDHSLTEAARKNDLDPETVVRMLDAATEASSPTDTADWTDASLGDLIDHIESTHHDYLRRELPRLERLLTQVAKAHGAQVPWTREVLDIFLDLKADLEAHMQNEEERVFPFIRRLAEQDAPADANEIEQLIGEHEEAGAALDQLRAHSNDYTPPETACPKFRAAMDGLHELEVDMHQHVHKENNILFPQARTRM